MSTVYGFQPGVEVWQRQKLFGHGEHDKLLDKVVRQFRSGTNIQLVGERRSGKTSVIRCAINEISQNNETIIPIYVNFRRAYMAKGGEDFYRHLITIIHKAVVQNRDITLPDRFEISGLLLQSTLYDVTLLNQLETMLGDHPSIIFENYVLFLQKYGWKVALFIDEYEHMMKQTLGGEPYAFFTVRDLSTMPAQNGHTTPLTYLIAGATPWNELCTTIGSPELNTTSAEMFVSPLPFTAFEKMWQDCERSSSQNVQEILADSPYSIAEIYDLTGGFPFFCKIIGHLLSQGADDEGLFYENLHKHFGVIWARLKEHEQRWLYKNVASSNGTEPNQTIRDLQKRGLLDDQFVPRGRLWLRFVEEQGQAEGLSRVKTIPISRLSTDDDTELLRLIVEDIVSLITEINEITWRIQEKNMFLCSNKDVTIYRDLRQPAVNKKSFGNFARAIYLLIFERTQVERSRRSYSLERLPEGFRKELPFVQAIDAFRHHYGDAHITQRSGFKPKMSVGKALKHYETQITGDADKDSFSQLQSNMLDDLTNFLHELKAFVLSQDEPLSG